MPVAMLKKMESKLERLQAEFEALFDNHPRDGHGGTPNIVDNAKGRQMMRACERLEERRRAKKKAINEQKEKIERMQSRIAYKNTQTKKSTKFIEENPIDSRLFELEKQGRLKQWKRNPQYFFVVGLDKVAIATFGGRVAMAARFPAKTEAEIDKAKDLFKQIEEMEV